MVSKVKCAYCEKEFSSKGIQTHIMRTHLKVGFSGSSGRNNSYTSAVYKGKIANAKTRRSNLKYGLNKDYEVQCNNCKTSFIVCERELKFPARKKYFCSRSCANSGRNQKNVARTTYKGKLIVPKTTMTVECSCCKRPFEKLSTSKKRTCSKSCASKTFAADRNQSLDKNSLTYYRRQCAFTFALNDYPAEFDFSLVEQHGWYKAKNRGNNLTGVSRDHIVSVRYGFDNNIDPKIISHPANCQLLQHGTNVSKGKKCDLTVEELIAKIEKWNAKYSK